MEQKQRFTNEDRLGIAELYDSVEQPKELEPKLVSEGIYHEEGKTYRAVESKPKEVIKETVTPIKAVEARLTFSNEDREDIGCLYESIYTPKEVVTESTIEDPIIPDALEALSLNPHAIRFDDKEEFNEFLAEQNYFNARESHCYYSEEDMAAAHKGESRFRHGSQGISEANRGCLLIKDSTDLVAIWDERNTVGFIVPSDKVD